MSHSAAGVNSSNKLANRDYTLLIDKSGSMDEKDVKGYDSRWHAVQESTIAISKKLDALDPDGITLYLFGGNYKRYDNVTPDAVSKVFTENEPMGGTNLHLALQDAFNNWSERKRKGEIKNGETLVIVTDGQPNDPVAVAQEIKKVTKVMDSPEELHAVFLQIGADSGATKFLRSLDNDLKNQGAKFDIVTVKTFDELENTTIKEALLATVSG